MKPQFSVASVIRVQIDQDEDLGRRLINPFMRWCLDNDIIGLGGSHGPTGLVDYFDVKHADQIREWLHQQDVKEVCFDV